MSGSITRTDPILVGGAGGFIGGWLVRYLQEEGFTNLRAVDIKPLDEWHQVLPDVENRVADLRTLENVPGRRSRRRARLQPRLRHGRHGLHRGEPGRLHDLGPHQHAPADRRRGTRASQRHFYSSSACIYNTDLQKDSDVTALREEDAYPALPEDGYGWEKLFSERMCRNFHDDFGIETRVARYHNVYGPHGTYDGGREKAPAAICRKVATAKLTGEHEIEIWGDGEQTRSFMYIDDCLLGTQKIMESDILDPLNLGSSELVTINQLVDVVEEIAGVRAEAALQPRCAEGRARAELGQHAHPRAPRLGAEHPAGRRHGEDVRLDLRRAGVRAHRSSSRRIRLMLAHASGERVISVIVYGRNDAHGYNLHRRAALSLNCIAEVLTDPGDEIVFVDYNTPDELPTFVEAIADTLTDRCLERAARASACPAAIHAERFAERTHLPAIEPVARNAGVRRANPANRWLLSTNTDMVFLPLVGREPERDLRRAPRRLLRPPALRASGVALGAAAAERSPPGDGRGRAPRPGACGSTSRL